MAKEIVFISGKGGTGKTTTTASFIPLLKSIVIADCDVDAPDLDILLKPSIRSRKDFVATSKAVIDPELCINCGRCVESCKFDAITQGDKSHKVENLNCEGCSVCTLVCPVNAISLVPYKTGEIFISECDYGAMIHARLTPGEEVSGRLVSEVRRLAKKKSEELGSDYVIIDGPPGIACNVISAITGVDLAVIVTEPSASGFHDLVRVFDTAKKLSVKAAVIINKDGLSQDYSLKIEDFCRENDILLLGRVPYLKEIRDAVNKKQIPSSAIYRSMLNKIEEV